MTVASKSRFEFEIWEQR